MERIEQTIQSLLGIAGIKVNGTGEADIIVSNPGFYRRVFRDGSIGLGESYMEGWWDVKKTDDFFYHVLNASLDEKIRNWRYLPYFLGALVFNSGRQSKAYEIGKRHYNLSNNLFQKMLDKRMVYSCAYWKDARNLDEAQEAKLDLICRKLMLKPGMKVLDIGCGWGSFARFAAEKYGVDVVGITVSEEQLNLGNELCNGLNVKLILQDYRKLDTEKLLGGGNLFDRIVSIGMIEHVGYKNYRLYMKIIERCLKEDGLFLLQTIGANTSVVATDPWSEKYIFPNSMLPSFRQIGAATEGLFIVEDWHSFGHHYDKTLMAWFANFDRSWNELKPVFDERFYRMWKFYLLSAAGGFRARKNQLWQIVFSKHGVQNGYESIR
jgi:cyclopropane-fatty-acyl-phospholipid synthase